MFSYDSVILICLSPKEVLWPFRFPWYRKQVTKAMEKKKKVLRFPLPPPNPRSNRRLSSTPSYHHGPRTPQALDAAICYAAHFTYDDPPPTHPLTSALLGSSLHLHRRIFLSSQNNDGEISYEHLTRVRAPTFSKERPPQLLIGSTT